MKVFHDWEFLEDGKTILPISVGMVDETGREFYAVFQHIQHSKHATRIVLHPFISQNVLPHLPLDLTKHNKRGFSTGFRGAAIALDPLSTAVMSRRSVAAHVHRFLSQAAEQSPVELWGWYSAYDHVALAQLFGPMVNRPAMMPMFTRDIKDFQLRANISDEELEANVKHRGPAHNALVDAIWTWDAHTYLIDQTGKS